MKQIVERDLRQQLLTGVDSRIKIQLLGLISPEHTFNEIVQKAKVIEQAIKGDNSHIRKYGVYAIQGDADESNLDTEREQDRYNWVSLQHEQAFERLNSPLRYYHPHPKDFLNYSSRYPLGGQQNEYQDLPSQLYKDRQIAINNYENPTVQKNDVTPSV